MMQHTNWFTRTAGLALVLVGLIVGCVHNPPSSGPGARPGPRQHPGSGHPAPGPVQPGGVLRLPLTVAVDDPVVQNLALTDPRLFALARCLELPLMRPMADGSLAAGIADSDITPDGGKTWNFNLRSAPGQDSDPSYLGKHLVQRYKEILRGPDSPLRSQLADQIKGAAEYRDGKSIAEISGIKLDGATLTIELLRPNQAFPAWTSQPGLGIMANRTLPAAGWGPYGWVKSEGSELVLKPNRDDSLLGVPPLDELRFVCEPDKNKQLELFRAGKLDAANVDFSAAETVRADATLKPALVEQETAAMYMCLFNLSEFPWKNSRFQNKHGMRAAMNEGIDMGPLVEGFGGQLKPWRHFVAPYFQDYIPPALLQRPVFANTTDLNKAQSDLKEADQEQGEHMTPGMDLGYRHGVIDHALVDTVLRYWKDISVKLKPFPLTADEFARRVGAASHHVLLVNYCPAYADVDGAFYPLLASALAGNGGNVGLFKDPEVDRLLYAGQAASDKVQRQKAYQSLEQYLEDEAYAVFLGYATPTLLISPTVGGYDLSPLDYDASLPAQDFSKLGRTETAK